METLRATVRQQGEGEQLWFCGGGTFTWKVTGAESGGAFILFEDTLEQGKVTPLHIHPEADETFYLLDGEILVHIDGEETRIGAGGVAVFPRRVPHAFMVTSPTARMLAFQNPAAGEAFYRHASETQPTPVDFDRVRAAAEATGAIEILGPPPFSP
jgi:quercetin dioxygenase-like cupin family protein